MQTISFAFDDTIVSSVVKEQLGHILAMLFSFFFLFYQKPIQSLNVQQMPTFFVNYDLRPKDSHLLYPQLL